MLQENIALLFTKIVPGIFVLLAVFYIYRAYYVASLLNKKGNPDLFLKEVERDIRFAFTRRYRNMLLVNKSAGLIYKGDFEDAVNLLKSIKPERFPRKIKLLYYNNLLSGLFLLERLDEAKELFNKHQKMFYEKSGSKLLDMAVKSTLAVYEMYFGSLNTSRRMLEELLNEKLSDLHRATMLYYIGLIELKEGKLDEAKKRFEEAEKRGKNSYIPQKINSLQVK